MSTEQRHFTRIPFNASATIINSRTANKTISKLSDISLKGVLVDRPTDWQGHSGEHYTLHIQLAGNEVEINLAVIAVHSDDNFIGFKTEHMEIESATHLHRLVELNLGDQNLLEREFHELVNAK
jgi:hypothetical protein